MKKAASILLVTEDQKAIKILGQKLLNAGFDVNTVNDLETVPSRAARSTYDLIVLKPVTHWMKSLELCRRLKNDPQTAGTPIIMISPAKDEFHAVLSLEVGADDHMVEPVSIREFVARTKAVMRRTLHEPQETKVLKIGEFVIDKEKCTVQRKGREIVLTAQAYKLLCFLVERRGKVFSREQLLEVVWKRNASFGVRTVDVHMRKLRVELEDRPSHPRYLKTFRGIGYFFDCENDSFDEQEAT